MVLTILLLLLVPQDGHYGEVFSSLIFVVFVGYIQGRHQIYFKQSETFLYKKKANSPFRKLLNCLCTQHESISWSGNLALLMLNLGSGQRWVVDFTPQPPRREPPVHIEMKLDGPPGKRACSLIIVPTMLFWLP